MKVVLHVHVWSYFDYKPDKKNLKNPLLLKTEAFNKITLCLYIKKVANAFTSLLVKSL